VRTNVPETGSVRKGVRLAVLTFMLITLWELVRTLVPFTSLGDGFLATLAPAAAFYLAFVGQRWPWSRRS
jgi:hypothetical protein